MIGPNVSLEKGSVVTDSALSNLIVGRDARITSSRINGGFLGESVVVENFEGSGSIGDHSEISGAGRS